MVGSVAGGALAQRAVTDLGPATCGTVAAVFSSAQADRLEACARVLDPPARVVMTGMSGCDRYVM